MILRKHVIQLLIIVSVLTLSVLPSTSHAQTASQIVINYPELTDVDNALQLGIYFNVADSTGRVTPDAKVKSARILLDDGTTQDAQVEQPTTPFYIALVLDASGSMSPSADAMRQAAIQAINDAPEQARFAVIRFNDKIDVLQDFTEDRNRAINAIGDVKPVNLAGTCLYDAAYQAIQQLGQVPQGRRAIILFTDGKDETAQGKQCSTHTFSDVVQFATRANLRVPINTIGLSTREQNINAGELRDMASSTGGLSAIGGQAQLSDLFTQIMDALKSQWLAKVLIYPMHGTHTATLTVTLDDGTTPQPAVVQFEVARDYLVPVTPSPTPTPIVVNLTIQAVTVDQAQNVVNLDVTVQGEQVISSYRFDFFDADTNLLLDSQTVPAPLPDPVTLSATKLSGKLRVELRALDANGKIISWPGDRNTPIDHATYDFSFLRPTPTPPPPTGTPIPIAVEINGIAYDQATDMISLDLSLTGQDQMSNLEISIFDARTNLRVNVYNSEPKESIQLAAKGLEPLHDYTITVVAQSSTGQNLARSSSQKFTYTPLLTPTPVPSPTFTPTPTLAPVQVTIGSIGIDESTSEIVVGILTQDQDRIKSFELQIRNGQTGLVVGNYVHEPPPYDTIRIPLSNIAAGQYTAILRAFGDNNTLLAEAPPLNFAYSPPPTATPEPSPTPAPTLTPTPTPGLITRASDAVRDNPALAVVVAVIAFALVVVLFLLLRPRKKPKTGTDFLSAQTGFYQFPAAGGAAPAPSKGAKPAAEATSVQPAGEAEATQFYPEAFPVATLAVSRSPAAARIGPSIQITTVPFKIGRGTTVANDLSLDEDTSVSRSHAVITYQNGHFFLVDQGSVNGTQVDGSRLAPQAPFQLYDGARITLGKGTELIFRLPGGGPAPTPGRGPGGEDLDKTDYVNMDDLKE
jgi:hypothetical protein